jgi:vitamin B12 transporter
MIMRKGAVVSMMFAWIVLLGALTAASAQESASATEQRKEAEAAKTDASATVAEGAAEAGAFEGIVVTADRIEMPVSAVTKSISVVTAEERDELQEYYLPELIDNEPGVFFRRNGGPGQFSNISIRGAGPQHTQYQYNGMPLRDAADTQSTLQYFIEDLYSGSNLKQVEILKGTQSTLYGSQAMGGVINIIPEKWKEGFGGEVRSEFGEHNTFIENGRVYYGQEKFYLDFNPIYVTTDGERNGGDHDYYYENLGFTAGAGVQLGYGMALEFSSIYSDSDLALSKVSPSLDANGKLIKNTADPDKHRESALAQYGLGFTHEVSSLWDYSLKGAYSETERHYFWNDVDGNQSNYDGSTNYIEMQHNIHATDWLTLVVGADYEQSDYDGREPRNPNAGNYTPVHYEHDWSVYDLFSEARLKFLDESLLLSVGGRYNDHEKFDSQVVGEASAAYIIKQSGTKIHGHLGSGYRTPSLYEIYGGYLSRGNLITIGNPDLEPEESYGYEFGIDQTLLDKKLAMGFTWFHTNFDNLIIYDNLTSKYMNANDATAEGIETYVDYTPVKWLKLRTAYTYTDSKYEDSKTGDWLRKELLPRNEVSGTATFYPYEGLTAAVRVAWQDEKIVSLYDPSYNSVRWEEPDAVTVDTAITYKFLKHYEVWLRVENLFDEDYSEGGYTMPGRWVYGGLKLSF